MNLSETKCLVPHITIITDKKMFALFDTEHLLKCIRNIWVNDSEKTLTYHMFMSLMLLVMPFFVIMLLNIIWSKN